MAPETSARNLNFFHSLAFHKALSVGLRGASLAAKLVLTLYMGRYLSLADMGVYGLVFAAVMIGTGVLGARLDFVVARDLVGASTEKAFRMMRDQAFFYGINYLFFAIIALAVVWAGVVPAGIAAAVFGIAVMESLAQACGTNMISMGHPLLSTFQFFVRSGLWGFVAVGLGLWRPEWRSVEFILLVWGAGAASGVLLSLWFWRDAPWRRVVRLPVDRDWLKASLRRSFPVWLGTVGAITASSMDRFTVSLYLDLDKVGIVTFYSSFALALLSLIHSGFFAFSYPRLISFHRNGDRQGFSAEAGRTGLEVATFVFVSAVVLGFALPACAGIFGKPELAAEAYTFWLMLAAVWVRGNADTFYYMLYARGRDKPLWLGDTLYLLPMAAANFLLVPRFGLAGVGYSSLLAAFFLLIWLGGFALRKQERLL